MAALTRQVFGKISQDFTKYHLGARFYAKKSRYITPGPLFSQDNASIASKGFLRPQKAYDPPTDADSKVTEVCESLNIAVDNKTKLQGLDKFNVLNSCSAVFKHSIPNSLLFEIETVGDVKKFYRTPVVTVTPLEALKTMDLPPNLHVSYEYLRFHPDTDKLFGGQTAFPESSTLVTGLKYKNKYPGHIVTKKYDPESVR
uniref:Large ribosomal subunit protein mL50 n=1 Tax=Xenopsylla cheopis TaxID=163159 RepID=A0A6M2DHE5_XENCH